MKESTKAPAASNRVRTIEEAAREAFGMVESLPADQFAEGVESAVMLAAEEFGVDAEAVRARVEILKTEAIERAVAEQEAPAADAAASDPVAEAGEPSTGELEQALNLQPGPGVEDPVDVAPEVDPADVGRLVAGEPSTGELEQALADFRLVPENVLGWRARGESIALVTAGGRKLLWPADKGRVLTQNERDGKPSPPKYPEGYLSRKAKK